MSLLEPVKYQRERENTLSPTLDRHYERLRQDFQPVFEELGIAA